MVAVRMRGSVNKQGVTVAALAFALGVGSLSATAQAQRNPLNDAPATPRMMGLGGRAEALGTSTSSMFGNPAAIVGTRSFHSDGYFLWDPTRNRFGGGSAVIDSTRSLFAGGFSYVYDNTTAPLYGDTMGAHEATRSVHDGRLNVALGFANHAIGIGGSVRYLNASAGPAPLNGSTLTADAWSGFTFAAGVYARPVQALQLSVMGHNLNNPTTTAAPIAVSGGLALTPAQVFSAVADVYFDFRTAATPRGIYSGGIELFIANHYVIRGGYQYDDVRNDGVHGGLHTVTGGLGYLHQDFGVELGMRQAVLPELQTTLMLSIRYFYRPQDAQTQNGSTQTTGSIPQAGQTQ